MKVVCIQKELLLKARRSWLNSSPSICGGITWQGSSKWKTVCANRHEFGVLRLPAFTAQS
jgi:hypothetical protein